MLFALSLLLALSLVVQCFAAIDGYQVGKDFRIRMRETTGEDAKLEPVIFVPGFAGSGIDAKLNRETTPHWFCWTKWDSWFNLWIAFYELLLSTCLLERMELVYNAVTDTFTNHPGVETRVRDFGGVSGIDYVDVTDDIFGWTIVYGTMVKAFQGAGYQVGHNLFGAPFDWRLHLKGIVHDSPFGDDLYNLLVSSKAKNNGAKAHIVTHSYGGIVIAYWMEHYRPKGTTISDEDWSAWVGDHIADFIPVAGPFSGTAKSLRGVLSGDTFGAPSLLVNVTTVARSVRSLGGLVQLVPDPGFWPDDFTFVHEESTGRNYNVAQLHELFRAVGADKSTAILNHTENLVDALRKPSVRTYCLYGFDVPTEISFNYTKLEQHTVHQPSHIDLSDAGDGVVPLLSLLECQEWHEQSAGDIRCREYDLNGHEDLQDSRLIADILQITTGHEPITRCETAALDSMVDSMGNNMPLKAKRVRALRAAREAKN